MSSPANFPNSILRALCASILLSSLMSGCGSPEPTATNAVLIIMDTTRADILGTYGGIARTPNIQRLADRGALFLDATAHNPYTLGSVGSILTSLEPDLHGLKGHDGFRLAPEANTLAETFQTAGYQTAAFMSALTLHVETGCDQGFDTYDADLSMTFPVYRPQFAPLQESLRGAQRRGDETVRRAVGWYQGRAKSEPFFMVVHLFDPHEPYDPPPPFQSEYENSYAGEVAYTDLLIGQFLDVLEADGILENTIVTVVGDHGESFMEHDEVGHGFLLYETTLHVPLIMAGPGIPNCIADGVAPLIDVAPTILGALGIEAPRSFSGIDLLPQLAGATAGSTVALENQATYIETYYPRMTHGWSELIGWRDGEHKYVRGPRPEFFDLNSDPGETNNLYDEGSAQVGAMAAALDTYLKRETRYRLNATAPQADKETLEKLASLGYVGTVAPDPVVLQTGWDLGLEDPKDAVIAWNRRQQSSAALRVALANLQAGQFERALEIVDESLRLNPNRKQAHYIRAQALNALNRNDEAIAVYEQFLAENPDMADAWYGYGMALDKSGRQAEARTAYETALRYDPDHPKAALFLGYQLVREQKFAEALPYYEKARQVDPKNLTALLDLGRIYVQLGNLIAARDVLIQALLVDPRNPGTLLLLGQVNLDLDDKLGAQRMMEQFLKFHPNRPEAENMKKVLENLKRQG